MYKTTDLNLATYLRMRNIELHSVEENVSVGKKRQCSFLFEIGIEEAKKFGIAFQNSEILSYMHCREDLRSLVVDY